MSWRRCKASERTSKTDLACGTGHTVFSGNTSLGHGSCFLVAFGVANQSGTEVVRDICAFYDKSRSG